MQDQKRHFFYILVVLSGALFLTIFIHQVGGGTLPLLAPLAYPGAVLDKMFLSASWFLPIYTGLMAAVIALPWTGWWQLGFLQLLWIPQLTLSVLFRVSNTFSNSPLSTSLIETMGRSGAVFLLMFFLVIELLVLTGAAILNKTRLFPWMISEEDIQNAVGEDEEIGEEYKTEVVHEVQEVQDIRDDPFYKDDPETSVVPWDSLKKRMVFPGEVMTTPVEILQTEIDIEEDPVEKEFENIFTEGQKVKVLLTPKGTVRQKRFPDYAIPTEKILKKYTHTRSKENDLAAQHSSDVLEKTLREFNIEAKVTGIRKGPVVTMFEILPAPGVKLSRIVALADNIALGLAAGSVRIVAPIPGKHAVGIEIPNPERVLVGFEELVNSADFQESKQEIPIVLGKDISGDLQVIDLTKTPHLLIAGATGSGKSVMVNSLICSILYKRSPDEVRMLMVDPKIVELKFFNDIPHLLTPVITEPKKALQAAQWCLSEMERRYSLLDAMGVRDIRSFNQKIEKKRMTTGKLPYIVFVVDEFADLMATSGKELENIIARLAAMSRAVGIHLVLATQRPSIDVITGLIKANFPSRIAFMVASKTDSRIILDTMGAEKLLGKGDMLFTSAWDPFPRRIQGAFLTEDEVESIVVALKELGEPEYITDDIFIENDPDSDEDFDSMEDPLWNKAVDIVTTTRKASASYLQRRMSIGYNRAARLVEEMERQGIVGPQNGTKPREIISGLAG